LSFEKVSIDKTQYAINNLAKAGCDSYIGQAKNWGGGEGTRLGDFSPIGLLLEAHHDFLKR
jgi:hypothetical protein